MSVMEAETRRRVGTGSSVEEETVSLVMEDELVRPGTPDSETTEEEPGNSLMNKRYSKTDIKRASWRARYWTERQAL